MPSLTATEKEATIMVYNINGQKMSNLNIGKRNIVSEIEVQNWTTGIYFYQLHSNGVILQTGKFTVQH